MTHHPGWRALLLLLAASCQALADKPPVSTPVDTGTRIPPYTSSSYDTPPCVPDGAGECDCGDVGTRLHRYEALEYFAPCTVISGLELFRSDITHFPQMSLRRVGTLQLVENWSLASIDGLGNLVEVTEELYIDWNPALESLDGLESLARAEDLSFWGNDALVDVSALRALERADLVEFVDNRALCRPHVEAVLADAELRELYWEGGRSICD